MKRKWTGGSGQEMMEMKKGKNKQTWRYDNRDETQQEKKNDSKNNTNARQNCIWATHSRMKTEKVITNKRDGERSANHIYPSNAFNGNSNGV